MSRNHGKRVKDAVLINWSSPFDQSESRIQQHTGIKRHFKCIGNNMLIIHVSSFQDFSVNIFSLKEKLLGMFSVTLGASWQVVVPCKPCWKLRRWWGEADFVFISELGHNSSTPRHFNKRGAVLLKSTSKTRNELRRVSRGSGRLN